MKVPFDSLCLAASLAELSSWEGAKVQRVVQIDRHTIGLELYAGRVGALIVSVDPDRARLIACARKLAKGLELSGFGNDLKRYLLPGRLIRGTQVGVDRIAHLTFETAHGSTTLVVELMGKHANAILTNEQHKMLASAKWLGKSKSRRPILPGHKYEPPPLVTRPSVLDAAAGDDLARYEGVSPFLRKWIESVGGAGLSEVQRAFRNGVFAPSRADNGAVYPLSLKVLDPQASSIAEFSDAAEEYFSSAQEQDECALLRSHLLGKLRSVLAARESALDRLEAARDTAARAAELQMMGQLLLSFQHDIADGLALAKVTSFDGNDVEIRLNRDLSVRENAEAYFQKAKKAKHGSDEVNSQYDRLRSDTISLRSVLILAEEATSTEALQELIRESTARRWLQDSSHQQLEKEERPFGGRSVRELLAPGGWRVLYGTNSEANDYLTLRVAKPNDWWLHVRGGPSCHVVIATGNQPQKVPRDVLEFAALVACRNSASKHSSMVAVDYTLKKYVRRPKGGAPGLAQYTHEKTLHVNPNEKK